MVDRSLCLLTEDIYTYVISFSVGVFVGVGLSDASRGSFEIKWLVCSENKSPGKGNETRLFKMKFCESRQKRRES